MGSLSRRIRGVALWAALMGTPALAFGRADPATIAADQRAVQECRDKCKADKTERDRVLEGDRTELQLAKQKLQNDIAALEEKLRWDKDTSLRANLARKRAVLKGVNRVLSETDYDALLAADAQAIEDARKADLADVQACMRQLMNDQKKWSAQLKTDDRALKAAQQKLTRDSR